MNRIIFFLLLQLATVNVFAQSFEKHFAIGIHGGASQYFGDLTNQYYDFTEILYGNVSLSFNYNLGHHWDVGLFSTYGESGFYLDEKNYFSTQMFSTNLNVLSLIHISISSYTAMRGKKYAIKNAPFSIMPVR